MSDEEISGSVSTSQNLVAQVSQAKSLDAKLDIDGNIVVESFRLDSSNLTLDSLSNTDITNPENGAYLYYDGSSQKWKDGGSLTTLVNSLKTESYPFVKRFSLRRGDYDNLISSSGQSQSFNETAGNYVTHYGNAYANSDPLGIPAPYSGTTKRQRVNITYDWHIQASGYVDLAEFDIQYRLVARSKGADAIALGTVKFPTQTVPLTELGTTVGRMLRIDGNVTDKLTYFGKIASTATGFNDADIESFNYNSHQDETEIKYNTGFMDTPGFDFSQGDTVYFSPERFTSSGQFYEIVNETKSYTIDIYGPGPNVLNGDNNFSQNFDIILPETTTKTDILVQSRLFNDRIGQTHDIKLRKLYGTVENLA